MKGKRYTEEQNVQILNTNHVWTYDFMHDTTQAGNKFKILTLIDEFTRESLAIVAKQRLNAGNVIEILSAVIAER